MNCPNCSAPAQLAHGQPTHRCAYCQTSFPTGAQSVPPPPPPSPWSQPPPPTFVIVTHHDHDESFHPHPTVHTVHTSGIGWITWVVVMLIIVGAGGGGFRFLSRRSLALGSAWDGSTPLHCAGNDQISVKGVHADFNAGTAVTVAGNCHFTCTDCAIKSQTAIEVGGNGNVTIINGSVLGSETLVDASGNARVNISGNVTVAGAVKQTSNAKVSAPKSSAAPPAASPPSTTPPPLARASSPTSPPSPSASTAKPAAASRPSAKRAPPKK